VAFDKTIIDDLLKRTDVVNVISNYITVNKKGRNFVALWLFALFMMIRIPHFK